MKTTPGLITQLSPNIGNRSQCSRICKLYSILPVHKTSKKTVSELIVDVMCAVQTMAEKKASAA